ncbi:MAG: hypothetical protein AB2L14_21230 [Candidatus Xenobiia bacterium LiM19]
MVDQHTRDKMAENIRHLVSGTITNREYEYRSPCGEDPILEEVDGLAWFMYDDLHEHRLTGSRSLTKEGRREVARWILFLKTDLEYEGPRVSRLRFYPIFWYYLSIGLFIYLSGHIVFHQWLALLALYLGVSYGIGRYFVYKHNKQMEAAPLMKNSDPSIWPFIRRSDYEAALSRPPYLRGKLET